MKNKKANGLTGLNCIHNSDGHVTIELEIDDSNFLNDIYSKIIFKSGNPIEQQKRVSQLLTKYLCPIPSIEKVIFNGPATIVVWDDGTKTIVKCQDGDDFDPEKGIALCFMKKMLGNNGSYYNIIKKHTEKFIEDYHISLGECGKRISKGISDGIKDTGYAAGLIFSSFNPYISSFTLDKSEAIEPKFEKSNFCVDTDKAGDDESTKQLKKLYSDSDIIKNSDELVEKIVDAMENHDDFDILIDTNKSNETKELKYPKCKNKHSGNICQFIVVDMRDWYTAKILFEFLNIDYEKYGITAKNFTNSDTYFNKPTIINFAGSVLLTLYKRYVTRSMKDGRYSFAVYDYKDFFEHNDVIKER